MRSIIEAVTMIRPTEPCEACGSTGESQNGCDVCNGAGWDNPVLRLHLGPVGDDPPGQSELTIIEPPSCDVRWYESLIGNEIWGDSDSIMMGGEKWADRVGYTAIKLC